MSEDTKTQKKTAAVSEPTNVVTLDPRLQKLIERGERSAKTARDLQKASPVGVSSAGDLNIPQKNIEKQLAAADGGVPDEEWHYAPLDRKLTEQYADQGYVPCVKDGAHFQYEGDDWWKIPADIWKRRNLDVAARGNVKLRKQLEQAADSPDGQKTELANSSADHAKFKKLVDEA